MELREALVQIAEIRRHMAKSDVFRGYRSAPVAFSGLLALVAAAIQARFIPEPLEAPQDYLALWIGTAALSMAAVAIEMALRLHHAESRGPWELTRLAVEQFLPSVIAGASVTFVLVRQSAANLALLPGLWQILFSLGIFASARLLPRPLFGIGAFYMCAGIVMVSLARTSISLDPWAMGVPFAVGQLASAGILYWTLERRG
jgi:hypothetical protein